MIRRITLVNAICKEAGIARRNQQSPNFSKKELYQLHTFLLVGPSRKDNE